MTLLKLWIHKMPLLSLVHTFEFFTYKMASRKDARTPEKPFCL
jgi:hypothetical protein